MIWIFPTHCNMQSSQYRFYNIRQKVIYQITIDFINGNFRDECLNMNWFMSLEDARDKVERWRKEYNEFRPHSALTYLKPAEYAQNRDLKPFKHRFFSFSLDCDLETPQNIDFSDFVWTTILRRLKFSFP